MAEHKLVKPQGQEVYCMDPEEKKELPVKHRLTLELGKDICDYVSNFESSLTYYGLSILDYDMAGAYITIPPDSTQEADKISAVTFAVKFYKTHLWLAAYRDLISAVVAYAKEHNSKVILIRDPLMFMKDKDGAYTDPEDLNFYGAKVFHTKIAFLRTKQYETNL